MTNELPIMEEFLTIQGEGRYTGTPAYFIRLGGCDVGCVWCDVKESWDAKDHPKCRISEIIKRVSQVDSDLVVITGGEPAMYDLSKLCIELKSLGKKNCNRNLWMLCFTWLTRLVYLFTKKIQKPD